jgi:hypothetical protein
MKIFTANATARAKGGFLAAALAMVLAVVACQDASTAPDTSTLAGYYTLVTVNDSALPRTVERDSAYLLQIVADTFALSPFGTWADLTIYAETSGGVTTPNQSLTSGNFTVSGTTLNFTSFSGDKFAGTVTNGALVIRGTATALYVKQ